MEIKFSNIIPAPIPEKDIKQSEIWGRDIIINSQEKVLIYAESGKGKTTFTNIIFGARKDYTGDVFLDGENIQEIKPNNFSEIRRTKLSIVPQGLSLFAELSLIENIIIKNKITNFKTNKEIVEMIELLGLEGLEDRKAAKMSFGQRQRAAVIRALCQPFKFILLDEAFSHLDSNNTQIVWDLIKTETKKQSAGIILTSLSSNFEQDLIKYIV